MPTALVTGATSGIGAAFARRLAKDGYALVLVARDAARLDGMRDGLTKAGAPDVETLSADLTVQADRDRVAARLKDDDRPVDLLVNNAGMGLGKDFLDSTPEELRGQVELNVTAVLDLARAALPGMVARDRGGIMNISSVASMVPGRGSTYSASKAWVTSFTESIAMTTQGTGVKMVAVCPGFVRTEFHERAGIDMKGKPRWMYVPMKTLVNQSLKALDKGRVLVVPGPLYKAIVGAVHLLPRGLVRRTASRV